MAGVFILPWYDRKLEKHQRYVEEYKSTGIRFKNDEKVLLFIDNNMNLMRDRPNMLQHDDFHVGNLIVQNARLSGIIDFNRYDWGIPYMTFLNLASLALRSAFPSLLVKSEAITTTRSQVNYFGSYMRYISPCVSSHLSFGLTK